MLMNLLGGKDTASAFQKIFHPLPNHHRVHFELLRNLVDRDRTTDGFQSHLGLEIGTVNLAFPTFCHATVLQNSSLNPCLKFGVHFILSIEPVLSTRLDSLSSSVFI